MTHKPLCLEPYSHYRHKRRINRYKENLTILKSSAKTETLKMRPPMVKPATKVAGIKFSQVSISRVGYIKRPSFSLLWQWHRQEMVK